MSWEDISTERDNTTSAYCTQADFYLKLSEFHL